ncbi:MAG: HAMP domain-containing histidine kinase [Chitinophagaceae bacterium]|nr:MAG: HAMP domain-containing histidine kinase [Chitinophagaceae bacterium]
MKVFTRYSRINILTMIGIFVVACLAFYAVANFVQQREVDESLRIEKEEIRLYTTKYAQLPNYVSVHDQRIEFERSQNAPGADQYRNIRIQDQHGEEEDYRQISFGVKVGTDWYTVRVSKSVKAMEHLVKNMLLVSITTILIILMASFFINRIVLKRLWEPFYRSLEQVRSFKVSEGDSYTFSPTQIDEFQLLNETLQDITRQAQLDYLSLKTFSENASHEIQTPIAVIRSKLDLLIQDADLSEKQSEIVHRIYQSIHKLSRLNGSLLLLAKIENRQFSQVEQVDLYEKLVDKQEEFRELWNERMLQATFDLQPARVTMNAMLVDILLNNLISNATNHTPAGGCITVYLRSKSLVIRNSRAGAALDGEQLFKRFYKPALSEFGTGLGLSLIRQICFNSGIEIAYSSVDQYHEFRLGWMSK